MSQQQFCLKWNNHTTNMLSVFENLLSTEALVDVTLACDGLSLKAHKMVLSACSPFFQSLFLENPCKHPIVIMKDMRYTDLKAIIDFMYRGEVNVSHDQLSALLKTAETLKVKGLAEVTGENRHASGIVQQEITQQSVSTPTTASTPSAQRTDTPPLQGKRKRGRPRKRSLSDSNRSDDEGVASKIKEQDSDIEELSGDASMEASDIRSGGGPISSNSQSQVPIQTFSSSNVNSFSKSHHHSSISQDPQVEEPASGDENEFEVEPSKLLEQTLTTENVPSNSQNNTGHLSLPSVSGLEISRRSMSSTDSQALVPSSIPSDSLGSNLQGPDSPQDIKPQLLSFDDPPISPVAGPSHQSDRSMMMYMDQSSMPGPSNFQDNSALVSHDSQPQEQQHEYWEEHPCKPMLTQTLTEISTCEPTVNLISPLVSNDPIMTTITSAGMSTPTFIQATKIPAAEIKPQQQAKSELSNQDYYQDSSNFLSSNRYRTILPATSANTQNSISIIKTSVSKLSLEKNGSSKQQMRTSTKKSKEKKIHCSFCAYSCKHQISLQRHLSKLHPESEGPPDLEEIKTNDSENITLRCSHCDYSCTSKIVLQYHCEIKHQTPETSSPSIFLEKEYKCVYCAFTGQHLVSYKRHLDTRHPGKHGSHDCDKCNFTTFNYMRYIHHLTFDDHQGASTQNTSI